MVGLVSFMILKSLIVKMVMNYNQVLTVLLKFISFKNVKSLKEIKWLDVMVIKGLFQKSYQSKICHT